MNIGAIIVATVVVAAVGLFIGIFLGVAGKKFAVETDEKEVAVREALPGNNCGGCGFPGCDGLAAAIAKGEAPVNGCPVGGDAVGKVIAGIMGQEVVIFISLLSEAFQLSLPGEILHADQTAGAMRRPISSPVPNRSSTRSR